MAVKSESEVMKVVFKISCGEVDCCTGGRNMSCDMIGQPPLIHNENHCLLTQLNGVDMVSACQSANLRMDTFAASTTEEIKIPRLSKGQRSKDRDDSTHSDV